MSDIDVNNQEDSAISLTAQLAQAQALLESDHQHDSSTKDNTNAAAIEACPISRALLILEKLQEYVQRASLFSKNELLADIPTTNLPLLGVEYYMAKAYLQLRTTSSLSRNGHVQKALSLFHLFLDRCHSLEEIFDEQVAMQYRSLPEDGLDAEEESLEVGAGCDLPSRSVLPSISRDDKIARYRQSKELKAKILKMNAQLEQRKRLDLEHHEEMEGHDEDSLLRSMYLCQLNEYALNAMEEIYSSTMELQMLRMAVQMEKDRQDMKNHMSSGSGDTTTRREGQVSAMDSRGMHRTPPPSSLPGMKMTQVLQDPITGQLIFKKQEIKSQVFRPSWNQPTMSLEQLAEKEVREAMQREAKQKEAEIQAKAGPRRYADLVRDGMEDDVNLVDASAKLDREWDDWKDDNPRGSGNKMGDRGDRNF